MKRIEAILTEAEEAVLATLSSPAAIQAYLDTTPYSPEDRDRCPLNVIRDRVAHCLDGGLFAAMALRRLGYPPLVVDLLPQPGIDDDHVLAIFKQGGCYGAVAKSNFVGLRYREPVYRSLRELVMSYFEVFYNVDGLKTLRGYTVPLNLNPFDRYGWVWDDDGVAPIVQRMGCVRRFTLLSPDAAGKLSRVDDLSYRAGMLVVNPAGLYKPKY
ncbi:MAG: hypothetical protein MUC51_00465 [Anaerolineae bacterium]|jgi:hypothetical protein|nr:hypothetical protein [Anaerolineae bacterium]